MLDSETSHLPSNATISRALRDTVIAIYKLGNSDDLTVKRVRTRTEEELGLRAGFLKSHATWNAKSKTLILEAVEKYCSDEPEPAPKAGPPKKAPKTKSTLGKGKTTTDTPRGVKRKAAAPAKKPKKRRKAAFSEDESEAVLSNADDDALSDADTKPSKKPPRRRKNLVEEDSEDENESPKKGVRTKAETDEDMEVAPAVKEPEPGTPLGDLKDNVSDGELSSLIDESPAKKKRQKKSPSGKAGKERKPKESKGTRPKADDDPDQAEIKRLQSWLVKCGIRKVWSKELSKYDTPKQKISHLKDMLKDAGMDGKYSNEKAARIKEQREFAKDLEDIQAGAMAWGKVDEAETSGRPRRRAAARVVTKPVVVEKDSDEDDEEDAKEDQDEASSDDTDDEVKPESENDGEGSDGSADSE